MAQLIGELFGVFGLDVIAPSNLVEFFPWFAVILFCGGFIGTLLGWLREFVRSFGKGCL